MEIHLSPRLAAIAELIPQGSSLADVGTDHGYLPIALTEAGRLRSAVASDLRPGPLERGRQNAIERGVSGIRFLLTDGLDGITAADADTVVIAGMGGDTIVDILSRAPWTRENTLLLLQPMSRTEVLRRALPELGLAVQAEHIAEDAGKLYSILTAAGGSARRYTAAEEYTGAYEHICSDPLFPRFVDDWLRRLKKAEAGASRSERAADKERGMHLHRVIEEMEKWRDNDA